MKISPLSLTTIDVRAAVLELEQFRIAQRTLSQWQARGLVKPSIRQHPGGPGPDAGALWSVGDLARLRTIAYLRKRGLSMQRIEAILIYLERDLKAVFVRGSGARLVVDGAKAKVERSDKPTVAVPSGQLELKFDAMWHRGNEAAAARRARAA